ncbi:uncharacterized protein LOC143917111 [Arctopsyche grandis]|uniref:uncharacterized protein LOC143917111 n=1 Tax=Arctopsyche grandis TaxID=121162 RepID=UPI00406D9BE9
MEPPGMSMFAGSGSVLVNDVNNSAERLEEEEEAAEDRRRLDLELRDQLQNAFDDLEDDDDDDDGISMRNSSKFSSMHMTRNTVPAKTPCGNLHDELSNEIKRTRDRLKHLHANDTNDYSTPYAESTRQGLQFKTPITYFSQESPSSDQQLKMLYEVRVREVQRLSEELNACRDDAAATHDALYGRLAIANAERERAQFSLQQSQELVANSKHHIMELEHKVTTLTNKVDSLQNRNEELVAEVTATTAGLIDAQNRFQAEKFNNGNAQNTDALFRAQQDRYKEDTERLERDLSRTRNKLMEKENELLAFEKRYIDMERLKEDLLVEKGGTINKLAFELEEAQNRLTNNDHVELKDRISNLTIERNTARLQVKELANKLENTATELVDTRGKLMKMQDEMSELESTVEQLISDRESDSFTQLKANKTGRGFSSHSDKIELLRNELTKSINIQNLRKDQIAKLNKSIHKRDEHIDELKSLETKLKREIDICREKEAKQTASITSLTNQLELIQSNSDLDLFHSFKERCGELEKELSEKRSELESVRLKCSQLEAKLESNMFDSSKRKSYENRAYTDIVKDHEKLTHQLRDANAQVCEFKNLYIEVCGWRDKLAKEVDELKTVDVHKSLEEERANVEELLTQLKNEKLKVDDLGNRLLNQQLDTFQKELNTLRKDGSESKVNSVEIKEYKTLIEELKEENEKLKLINEERNGHLSLMINELEESKQLINQLNSEIELQEQREALIGDLKEKAIQFEKFITDQNEKVANRKNASTSPKPPIEEKQVNVVSDHMKKLEMEKQIRQEVAQHFSVELKNIENEYSKKMFDMEQQFNSNLIQLDDILKIKTMEVETLQQLVLSERTKFQDALSKSRSPVERKSDHDECKKQMLIYQNNIETLSSEIKAIKSRSKLETENSRELKELKSQYLETSEQLEKLKEKYKTAKKIAIKYKEYIIEKDKHVNSEINRIKNAYEDSLGKLNDRLKLYIEQHQEQIHSKSSHDENISHAQSGKSYKSS